MSKQLLAVGLAVFAAGTWLAAGTAEAQKVGWYQYTFPPKSRVTQPAAVQTQVVVPAPSEYISVTELFVTDHEVFYGTPTDPAYSEQRHYDYVPYRNYWYPGYLLDRWRWRR